jgi:predicted nuclease with TOPRIM domain
MNQATIRTFVRQMITEAKKEVKMKKEEKLPKSSGKLMDLKKELAALKQMKDELQTAKFAEKTAETEVEFANLQKFAKELDKLRTGGAALESSIDTKISEIEDRISSEKNKIKEMIGMIPATGQEKIEDVKKPEAKVEEAKLKPSAIVTKKTKPEVKKVKVVAKAVAEAKKTKPVEVKKVKVAEKAKK